MPNSASFRATLMRAAEKNDSSWRHDPFEKSPGFQHCCDFEKMWVIIIPVQIWLWKELQDHTPPMSPRGVHLLAVLTAHPMVCNYFTLLSVAGCLGLAYYLLQRFSKCKAWKSFVFLVFLGEARHTLALASKFRMCCHLCFLVISRAPPCKGRKVPWRKRDYSSKRGAVIKEEKGRSLFIS